MSRPGTSSLPCCPNARRPIRPTRCGCHRPRVRDRIVFDKLLQLLRFGCSYQAISNTTCSATTIRNCRDEWIRLGVFALFMRIALKSCDRIVGLVLVLDEIAIDGSVTEAPGGPEVAGHSPVDRSKRDLKRSGMTDSYGSKPGRVLAGANRHDSPLLVPTLDPARRHHGAFARRLRLGQDPHRTRRPQPARPHRAEGREGADPGQSAVAYRAHPRLAERLPPPCYERRSTVVNAFFEPRGHDHHRA